MRSFRFGLLISVMALLFSALFGISLSVQAEAVNTTQFGLFQGDATPTAEPTPVQCRGTQVSRLRADDVAQVVSDLVAIKREPRRNAPNLDLMRLNQTIVVLEGPICFDNLAWYKIIWTTKDLEGWAAEGDAREYWLEKLTVTDVDSDAPVQCRGTQVSRLKPDDVARVSSDLVTLKRNPSRRSVNLDLMNTGDEVVILEGPFCADNLAWYKVLWTRKNIEGWAPEGNASEYWMETFTATDASAEAANCRGTQPSRLKPNDLARVVSDLVAIKRNPSRRSVNLDLMRVGDDVAILEGPFCADNLAWYKIVWTKKNLEGWAAEGDATEYWLEKRQ